MADISPIKISSKAFADIGEEIVYTISFTNTGTVDGENIVITDPIPNGTSYVSGSINSNVLITGDPTSSISLNNNLAPGGLVTVSYNLIVNSIPTPNPIINIATVDYSYDSSGTTINESRDSNSVSTEVRHAEITSISKTRDLPYGDIGDEITYTLDFTNFGNVDADNIVITDIIPNGTTYVGGSISSNVSITGDPTSTIILDNPLGPTESATISFRVLIDSIPNPNPIPNSASLDYEYTVNPSENPVQVTLDSNEVFTEVRHGEVADVVKLANKSLADIGEDITYTISFTNSGNIDIVNVELMDVIPSGTNYVDGSISSNVTFSGNPTTFISFNNPIAPGENVILTFNIRAFEIPTPNPIPNTATLEYEYNVDPGNPNVSDLIDSNTVYTQINHGDLEPVSKSVDKVYADVNEEIEYTISFTNTGNVDVENIVITDPIANKTSYVPGSISGDVGFTGDPTTTINLTSPLAPGDTANISYRIIATDIPDTNPLPNSATVNYDYEVDSLEGLVSAARESNTVFTQINHAEFEPVLKSSDRYVVQVGEEVEYKITFTNSGNVDARDVVITDPVRASTRLVAGSLNVNVSYTGDLDNGIHLTNPVAPNESITITYRLLILEVPNPNPIPNIASTNYNYIVDPNKAPVDAIDDSNLVEIFVVPIVILKNCSVEEISLGEIITYSFEITNYSPIDVANLMFFDNIPRGTEFVEGSFIGDSIGIVTGADLENGINLGTILAGETKNIEFQVRLVCIPCPIELVNLASLEFSGDFLEGFIRNLVATSNECAIDIILAGFKESNFNGIIDFYDYLREVKEIIDVQGDISFGEYKIVESPIGVSNENQMITGKKLIVPSYLCLRVCYIGYEEECNIYELTIELPLCNYIVIPDIVDECYCKIVLVGEIEYIYFEELEGNRMFFNVVYLIESGI